MTTPTTVNDISDVARILREHPEWLDVIRSIVIGEELLSVPQQLAELTQRVDALTQRVDALTQQVNDFVRATNENFRLVNERLERLETGQAELRADVAELRTDFAHLEGRFSNFEGSDYERRVRNRLISRSVYRFDLTGPAIVMTQDSQSAPELNSAIHRAIQSGVITVDDSDDLHEADIIIRDEDNRYLLAEVSITAENDDVERAVRRSQLLSAAANATVIPALVAANVAEPQRALADAHGVSLFVIPYP